MKYIFTSYFFNIIMPILDNYLQNDYPIFATYIHD